MNLRYLLDTNICIYIAKQKPQAALQKLERMEIGEVAMSTITYGELLFGAEKSQQSLKIRKILEELITLIPPLDITQEVCQHYANIRLLLERKGTRIGNNDLWIASHSLALETILVTNNMKEFSRVPNLKLENWA